MGHLVDGDTVAALNFTKLVAELGRGRRTIRRVASHGPLNDRGHVSRQSLLPQVRDRLRRDPQELSDHLLAALALECGMAGQRTEQRRTQRIHVRCRRRRRALEHFRRRESRRPGDHPCRRLEGPGDFGDSEVGQLGLTVVGQQDVSRLHVTVQCVGAVRGFESPGELHADGQRLGPVERSVPAYEVLERILGVVGHDDERPAAIRGADAQNGHDVRVSGEAAHGALLAQEAGEIVRVKVGVQYLHGNRAVERGLRTSVDDTEAAMPDLLDVVKSHLTQFSGDVRAQTPLGGKRIDVGHRQSLSSARRRFTSR